MTSEPQRFNWPGGVNASPTKSHAHANNQANIQANEQALAAADIAQQRKAGYDAGYAEGLSKAQTESAQNTEQQLEALAVTAEQVAAYYRDCQHIHLQVLQLIAVRLLGEALAVQPSALTNLLAQAQLGLPAVAEAIVACHPSRIDALKPRLQQRLIADPQLPEHSIEVREGSSALRIDLSDYVAKLFEDWPVDWAFEPSSPAPADDA